MVKPPDISLNSGSRRIGLIVDMSIIRSCYYRCFYIRGRIEPGVKANGYQS